MAKFTDDVEDKTYTYTYDLSDRLIESYRSDNAYVRQSFNAQNLTSGLIFSFGGISGTTSYTYNSGLDNAPSNATFSGVGKENFSYDALGRTTAAYVYNSSNANVMHTDYTYKDKDSAQTSGVVSRVKNVYNTTVFSDYTYTYDVNGNITRVTDQNNAIVKYTYDNLNRLTRCDDGTVDKTWTFAYDKKGNITTKKIYYGYFVDGTLPDTPDTTVNYTYGNSNWADLLTSYGSHAITYDAIGNMLTYSGRTLTWSGRRLASFNYNNKTTTYTYNADGIRTSKTVDGVTTEFFLNGTQILAQKTGDNSPKVFYYDQNGKRVAFKNTDGAVYFYVYNLQGDVVQLLDSSRNIVGEYVYGPYGYLENSSSLTTVAQANPFRYRGYYYDSENGYYYLNARYYYPVFGRFISADIPETTFENFENFAQYNLFAYCFNNPVNNTDESGNWPSWATKVIIGAAAVLVGAAIVALTGGTAAAFAGAAIAGLKAAAVSGAIGAAVGAGTNAVKHIISTGNTNGIGKAVLNGAIDGFGDGFMIGGITAGAGMAIGALGKGSCGIQIGKTAKPQYGRVNIGYGTPKTKGTTVISIQNKAGNRVFGFDLDAFHAVHMHLPKIFPKKHIPIGAIASGLVAGLKRLCK